MGSVHSSLPRLVRRRSDIPGPDNEILPEILDHHIFAEDLRTEVISECTLLRMKIDQQRTRLE